MKRRHVRLLILALFLAALTAIYAARGLILPALGAWLDVGESPKAADYVMVLTGEENSRPYMAAALVRAGYAHRILVAKIDNSLPADEDLVPSAEEIVRRVLVSRGVPAEDVIILPHHATTTFDEAQALASFLKVNSRAGVLIVTNHCHTRRARWIFSHVLGDLRNISFISAPTDEFELRSWWQTYKGFTNISGEYCKMAFYGVRYGSAAYWLAAAAALLLIISIYRLNRRKRLQPQPACDAAWKAPAENAGQSP
jgi:uncharacterized SAM-binding protein YcdF (DUF218 family)